MKKIKEKYIIAQRVFKLMEDDVHIIQFYHLFHL